jgi:heme/copper-type cytochrome/quinol oxidase subunit 2
MMTMMTMTVLMMTMTVLMMATMTVLMTMKKQKRKLHQTTATVKTAMEMELLLPPA